MYIIDTRSMRMLPLCKCSFVAAVPAADEAAAALRGQRAWPARLLAEPFLPSSLSSHRRHCYRWSPSTQALMDRATDEQAEALVRGYSRLCGDGPTEVPSGGGGGTATVDGMGVRCACPRENLSRSFVPVASCTYPSPLCLSLLMILKACVRRRYKALALVHSDLAVPAGFESAVARGGGEEALSQGGAGEAGGSGGAAGTGAGGSGGTRDE